MITNFISPTNIQQIPDTEFVTIPWVNLPYCIGKNSLAMTDQPLYTISGLWMERFRSKTNQIWTTGYNIPRLPNDITGISLRVNINRAARIRDLIIQLTLGGELIGQNYAFEMTNEYAYMHNIPLVGDYNVYGGSADMWGTELTAMDVADPSFGAALSFQSNETLPHRDLAYINQIAIQVNYR
jgi:hypothetical protein